MNPMKNPLLEIPLEEIQTMTHEELDRLLDKHNEYVRNKYRNRKVSKPDVPHFSTEEEFYAYYNAIPFDEADRIVDKMFNNERLTAD